MKTSGGIPKGSWPARIGLVLCGLLMAALAGEILLRASGYQPPAILTPEMRAACQIEPNGHFTYHGYLTGMFSDFATPVQLNSRSFHDIEHPEQRAVPGAFRLMVIGDSYVADLSCPLETTFYRRLEVRLNQADPLGRPAYEVIACGQGNQGEEKEQRYITELGPVYQPDAVLLLFFCGNDIMENEPETFQAARHFALRYQRDIAPWKAALYNRLRVCPRSRLNGLLAEAATTFYADHLNWFVPGLTAADLVSPELGVYRRPLEPVWQAAYDRTGELLAQMKAECEKIHATFMVAGLSGPQAVGDVAEHDLLTGRTAGLDPGQPARWLEDWCREHGVPYVALDPPLKAAGWRQVFWRHDGHLNPRGNEVIVEPLFRQVVDALGPQAGENAAAPAPRGI